MLNVTFEDETHAVIKMYFEIAPTPGFYLNMGTVEVSDPRWHVFFYKFDDFMREGWPEPTYAPPVDQHLQMPEVEVMESPLTET
ncbi:Uncharacterised protein [Yersinia massiliensis]|uniref:hypothetical protein n=1 Tax=Yersinia massiliensis TaxID=419257 RepID=UPI0005DE83EA|nr:hypothetical protein [Yersinia massiliensis]CNH88349.1 Uncharacterised protein [Yersinia massiliensis]